MALECGCDILMGTVYFDSINAFCKKNGLKYMPFIGNVYNRPSILDGSIESMINQANEYIKRSFWSRFISLSLCGQCRRVNKKTKC